MTMQSRPLRALLCASDQMGHAALAHAADNAGFAIVEKAENGPAALTYVELLHPTLLLISNELQGMLGHEVIETLQRLDLDAPPETVLVSADPAIRERAIEAGAWAVVPRGDLDALDRVLAEVRLFLETGERRMSTDRRDGSDRREKQDWSKVTQERRAKDRRGGERRTDDEDDDATGPA